MKSKTNIPNRSFYALLDWLLVAALLAMLCALLYQSSLDGQCMKYHADGARWTVDGVYCWRDKNGMFREYFLLEDLRQKHEGPKVDPTIRPTPTFGADI